MENTARGFLSRKLMRMMQWKDVLSFGYAPLEVSSMAKWLYGLSIKREMLVVSCWLSMLYILSCYAIYFAIYYILYIYYAIYFELLWAPWLPLLPLALRPIPTARGRGGRSVLHRWYCKCGINQVPRICTPWVGEPDQLEICLSLRACGSNHVWIFRCH